MPNVDIDFDTASDDVRDILLTRVDSFDLPVRARNILQDKDVVVVGQLAQISALQLHRVRNCGAKTVRFLKSILEPLGLSLGSRIQNWPTDERLEELLAERARSGSDLETVPGPTRHFIEDELVAVVDFIVKEQDRKILLRRTGWDGGPTMTLETLAQNPDASGLKNRVTRERIRQLEKRAFEEIGRHRLSTPVLDAALRQISEAIPISLDDISDLLSRSGLTRSGFDYQRLWLAMSCLGKALDPHVVDDGHMLVNENDVENLATARELLIGEAANNDFCELAELLGPIESEPEDSPRLDDLRIADILIQNDPDLEWLDKKDPVFWSSRRCAVGHNKVLNVCRKIFTVTTELSIKRIMQGIQKARTVRRQPSRNILKQMLLRDDNFIVDGELVTRSDNFIPGGISGTDLLMVNAAKELGTVSTFTRIRDFLVRQGITTNHAQVLIAVTPLWTPLSRGKYRFIASSDDLDNFEINSVTDEPEGEFDITVDFVVSPRHQVMGTHRVDTSNITPGDWQVINPAGDDLGTIHVAQNRLKGLSPLLKSASINNGSHIVFSFSDENSNVVLSSN